MKFRPCIDIHNGKVKQIVGGSLTDVQDQASENFVSEQDASFYAELYKKAGIKGGHVILLNGHDSPYYESTKEQALLALHTYSGGLQIGGGVNPENAGEYLDAGASHVIVTSYVFKDGRIFLGEKTGDGIHHIAFMTDDRDAAVKYFEENDMPIRHYGEYEGGNYTVFDSKEKLGTFVQVKYEPKK